jgi:uncharacterized protein (TIGR02453 family)
MNVFSERAFVLLAELKADNSKAWFDDHRNEIRLELLQPFVSLLDALTERLSTTPHPLQGSERTMFRMNRDVRFSKDKSPYSTHVSGVLSQSGSKKDLDGIAYLHLDQSGGFAAVGWYNLSPEALGPIRDHMVEHPDLLLRMVKSLKNAGRGLSDEQSLKSMPRGYSQHAESEIAPYLRMKTLMVRHDLPKARWKSGAVVDDVVKLVLECQPLLAFGRECG